MTALLKDALAPNLVQTLEGTPAFVHGGPFANIAHGCNSVMATTTALKLCDYVVTEAGFGVDLGAEKFFDIKCRKTGLAPDCVVLVATIRALKMHGGVKKDELKTENLKALETGLANLQRHVENVQKFGLVPIVSVNRFSSDTDAEIDLVTKSCAKVGVEAFMADHWAEGGAGAVDVAHAVVKACDSGKSKLKLLYPDDMPLYEKIRTIAKEIYRAKDISADKSVRDQLAAFEAMGCGKFPVCIAKTQYSFTTNADTKGAPVDHTINVREVQALGRCRVRGGDLRRDHDDARPAARAGRGCDRRRPGREDCGAVLSLSSRRKPGPIRRVREGASSEPGCSRDQKQPCPDGDGPDDSRDALTGRCETFDGDGCRYDGHRAKVHDPDDQEDRHQTQHSIGCSGGRGAGRVARPCRRRPAACGRARVPPGSRRGDAPSTR